MTGELGHTDRVRMTREGLARLSDQDLKSIFAYLQTLTPVSNRVPGPVSPDKVVVAK